MNSGIQDAYNLVWKLAFAIKDPHNYDALLDTYHTERSEVGKRVGQTSLDNMRSHSGEIDAAMGVCDTQTKAENDAGEAGCEGRVGRTVRNMEHRARGRRTSRVVIDVDEKRRS